MKKQRLAEGVTDMIMKLLGKGKYQKIQKNFKDNPEVQKAIKQAELSRKKLHKSLQKFEKAHGKSKSTLRQDLIKKYGKY